MKYGILFLAFMTELTTGYLYLWDAEIACPNSSSASVSAITVQYSDAKWKNVSIETIQQLPNRDSCPNGYYKTADVSPCQLCPVGHWCANGNIKKCEGQNSTQYMAAYRQEDCKCLNQTTNQQIECSAVVRDATAAVACAPGQYDSSFFCYMCPLGFFCRDSKKLPCPIFSSTAQRASTSVTDCVCELGFRPSLYKSSLACIPHDSAPAPAPGYNVLPGAFSWQHNGSFEVKSVHLHDRSNAFELDVVRTTNRTLPPVQLRLCAGQPQCKILHMDVVSITGHHIKLRVFTVSPGPLYFRKEDYTVAWRLGRVEETATDSLKLDSLDVQGHELYFSYIPIRRQILTAVCPQTHLRRAPPTNTSVAPPSSDEQMLLQILDDYLRQLQNFTPFDNATLDNATLDNATSDNATASNTRAPGSVPDGYKPPCDLKLFDALSLDLKQKKDSAVAEKDVPNAELSGDGDHLRFGEEKTLNLENNFEPSVTSITHLRPFERFQAGTALNFKDMKPSRLLISSTPQYHFEDAKVFFQCHENSSDADFKWTIQWHIPQDVYYNLSRYVHGILENVVGRLHIQHLVDGPRVRTLNAAYRIHPPCFQGYLWSSDGAPAVCMPCPKRHLCRNGEIILSCLNGTRGHRCACQAGRLWDADAFTCVPVARGWFSDGETATACPAHSSAPTDDATSKDSCQCDLGYYKSYVTADNFQCLQAEIGFYALNSNRESCPHTKTTRERGSTREEHCVCSAGHYLDAGICLACDASQHCPIGTISPPTPCETNEIQVVRTGKCGCKAGYHKHGHSGKCEMAARGFFVNEQRSVAHARCPPGLTTLSAGQSSSTSCVCADVGRVKAVNTSRCVCDTRHYEKKGICLPCPDYMHTAGVYGATEASACVCMDGFEKNNTSQKCQPCEIGYFCTAQRKIACPVRSFGVLRGQKTIKHCLLCEQPPNTNDTLYTLPARVGTQVDPPFLACAQKVSLRNRTLDRGYGVSIRDGVTGFHSMLIRVLIHDQDVFKRSLLDGDTLELGLREYMDGFSPFKIVERFTDASTTRIDFVMHDEFFAHMLRKFTDLNDWQILYGILNTKYLNYIKFTSKMMCSIIRAYFANKMKDQDDGNIYTHCTSNSVRFEFQESDSEPKSVFNIIRGQMSQALNITVDDNGNPSIHEPYATRQVYSVLDAKMKTNLIALSMYDDQILIMEERDNPYTDTSLESAHDNLQSFGMLRQPCSSPTLDLLHQPSVFCSKKYKFYDTKVCTRCLSAIQFYNKTTLKCESCTEPSCKLTQTSRACCAEEDSSVCESPRVQEQNPLKNNCRNKYHELDEECDPTDESSLLQPCCSDNCTLHRGFYRFPPCATVCGDGVKADSASLKEVCEGVF